MSRWDLWLACFARWHVRGSLRDGRWDEAKLLLKAARYLEGTWPYFLERCV